jgi:hypothetical protein
MNSDGNNFCTKLVELDVIYNFVVKTFFTKNHVGT